MSSCGGTTKCRHTRVTEKYEQRCVASNENIIGDRGTDRHMCVAKCVQDPNCLFLNYNTREERWVLGQRSCSRLEPDDQSQMLYFGPGTDFCFRWVPAMEHATGELIPMCGYCTQYIARAMADDQMLPGYIVSSGAVETVLNGELYSSTEAEVLDVMSGCEVTWMAFVVGDPFPREAIVGGYSSGETQSPLYIMRASIQGSGIRAGYYDPDSEIGYVGHNGVIEVTSMQLLVLI